MVRVYEFKCKTCETIFETKDKDKEIDCCGERAVRLYSKPSIQFKGSGFYSTDRK